MHRAQKSKGQSLGRRDQHGIRSIGGVSIGFAWFQRLDQLGRKGAACQAGDIPWGSIEKSLECHHH